MKNTDIIIGDLNTLKSNTQKLEGKVKSLDKSLKSIVSNLSVTKHLYDKLNNLDSNLGTAIEILEVVQIIPPISGAAANTRRVIKEFRVPVTKAKNVAKDVDNRVKPIRDKVVKVEKKVAEVDGKLKQAIAQEDKFTKQVGQARNCIKSLPEGEVKKQSQSSLEAFSIKAAPPVKSTDQLQIGILNQVNNVEAEIYKVIHQARALVDIDRGIDNVMKDLKPFIDALTKVRNALNHTIRVPYGTYPTEVCYKWKFIPYPCNWKTKYFSFSVKQIIDGVRGVLKPVIWLLEKAMNAFLNPILKALKLNIKLPPIPGIEQLQGIVNQLVASFDVFNKGFDGMISSIDTLTQKINELRKEIEQVEYIYNQCMANVA